MAELHQVRSVTAHFKELKHISFVNTPLVASGSLQYIAPDRLEKITLTPKQETIRLNGRELTGTRPGETEPYTLSLADHPDIAALVEAIRSTLAGDLPTLQRYYSVALEGPENHWRLTLLPNSEDVRRLVAQIIIIGAGNQLTHVGIYENDGDSSEMVISQDPV